MIEHDPYFRHRLEQGKAHCVLSRIDITEAKKLEAESNKEKTKNPTIEGDLAEFAWSERAVNNIIDADAKGYIKIEAIGDGRVKIEFLPLKNLPEQLGHVTELTNFKRNLKKGRAVFGSAENSDFTYLQTTDFAVEGYMDDEKHGKEYARVFIATDSLRKKRNVYLDPESINVTDYEYPYSFCVFGGIPFSAFDRVEVIRAKAIPYRGFEENDYSGPTSEEEWKRQMKKYEERLRRYLLKKKA